MHTSQTLFGFRFEGDGVARWMPAVVLTLLDAVLTYLWLATGIAREGNPWLAELVVTSGPGTAMAVRTLVGVGLIAALALLTQRSRTARHGLVAVTAVLGLVLGWHIGGSVMVALV
ncbi:MAG: hypothetical protein KY457_04215 [Actinobacteria bacterium]|nr:hypothetical protein [Actinomycetota bacterium]